MDDNEEEAMEDDKKGAVLRAEREHEKRDAIWSLGSSIAGIICWVGLIAFLLKLFGHRCNRANIGNELLSSVSSKKLGK